MPNSAAIARPAAVSPVSTSVNSASIQHEHDVERAQASASTAMNARRPRRRQIRYSRPRARPTIVATNSHSTTRRPGKPARPAPSGRSGKRASRWIGDARDGERHQRADRDRERDRRVGRPKTTLQTIASAEQGRAAQVRSASERARLVVAEPDQPPRRLVRREQRERGAAAEARHRERGRDPVAEARSRPPRQHAEALAAPGRRRSRRPARSA